jgi:cobalamin-dependent methionine synthase I
VNYTKNPANWRHCCRNYTHTRMPRKETTMKRSKKYKKKEVMEKARRYELTDIVKEAMSQGVIMEQMYGAEKDTLDMIEQDDPIRITEFILKNIDDNRWHMEGYKKKILH